MCNNQSQPERRLDVATSFGKHPSCIYDSQTGEKCKVMFLGHMQKREALI